MAGDIYVGEILLVAFNFAPAGFALCHGQVMPIVSNTALFSLLGTQYGGDGRTTFALPDLRGRVPAGLSDQSSAGDQFGAESVTLGIPQMPVHTHALDNGAVSLLVRCATTAAAWRSPVAAVPAVESGATRTYSGAADSIMNPSSVALGGSVAVSNAGSGMPHENRQPFLTLNYCIALQGVYPPRP